MTRAIATGAILCLLASTAAGQATLGTSPVGGVTFQPGPTRDPGPPPPSPVTPITPAPAAPPPDLFRAGPHTYAPRYDRKVPPPVFPWAAGGYFPIGDPIERTTVLLVPTTFPFAPTQPATAPTASSPIAPVAPAVAPKPGHNRPLYVIPNCYLGDRPPAPDRLPPGCTAAAARQIP